MVLMTNCSSMTKTSSFIALVDDDEFVLEALAQLLDAWGICARAYPSPQEFLCSLHDGLPECLITDLQMPKMTGLELHDQLKGLGIQIPTIIITGEDDIRVRERCESAGVVAFLLKPVQCSSLLNAISDATKKAQFPS